jgi:crossover junction endodeoxyribonuclease RuvC
MIIIGIDPGTTRVGYGLVSKNGHRFSHIKSGLVPIFGSSSIERLVSLDKSLGEILDNYKINLGGVERLYFSSNQKTALSVAEARGVILCSLAKRGISIREVAPTEVKASLTGSGRANKEGVAKMVGHFLNMDMNGVIDDVADALAVAITAFGSTEVFID